MAKKAKKKDSDPSNPLMAGMAAVKAALKKDDMFVNLDSASATESVPHLPSGSLVIDYLIGGKPNSLGVSPCPGIPMGRIMNLYGHESSGKTTMALTIAAQTIKDGGTVCYIDWENEIVPAYAKALGVPVADQDKFLLVQPETLEEGLAVLWTMATAGVSLIVLDSVGAGVPKALFEKSIKETGDQGRVGANAAAWSQFLPKLRNRIQKTRSTIIGISQIRDSINTMGYGDTFTVQGGKAWKFYSALRMKLQKIKTEKSTEYSVISNKTEDVVIGVVVKAKLDKCKVAPSQGNEEKFYIRFGEGIDDLRSMLEIAVSYKLIDKSGSWLEWRRPDGEEPVRLQGMEKMRSFFLKEPSLARMLHDQIKPHMAANGGDADDDDDVDLSDAEESAEDAALDEDIKSIIEGISE